jgi:HK97 family phage prohead protease
MAMARKPVQLFESKDAAQMLRLGKVVDVRKDAEIDRELPLDQKDAGGSLQQVAFIISDASKDRYGDTVSAEGWDFQNFNANRVLLWAHDYRSHPVGTMGEPWKTVGNKIKAVVEEWVPRELSEFAWATEQMVRRGFLNAVSVGFRPTEYSYNDDYSVNYIHQELLEVSVVPVPANPNALVAAKSAGLWVPSIDRWLEERLDEKQPGVVFDLAKKAWSVVRAPTVQVPGTPPPAEEPALPEVLELRDALKAHDQVTRDNTAALKEHTAALKSFTESVEKASARATVRAPVPPPPPPPPRINAERVAGRALELLSKSKT